MKYFLHFQDLHTLYWFKGEIKALTVMWDFLSLVHSRHMLLHVLAVSRRVLKFIPRDKDSFPLSRARVSGDVDLCTKGCGLSDLPHKLSVNHENNLCPSMIKFVTLLLFNLKALKICILF